jgi:hypothetical protein
MIRHFFLSVQERRWNRDRSRRIAELLQRDRSSLAVQIDWLEGMAIQLAEIRTLPEVPASGLN